MEIYLYGLADGGLQEGYAVATEMSTPEWPREVMDHTSCIFRQDVYN